MNSVVFRGLPAEISNYKGGFNHVLRTLRRWHDGEVILSTWENACLDFDRKMIDKLVLSVDPGPNGVRHHRNTNRQLTLAVAGVQVVTGKKTLLTRTDIRHGKNLFEIHGQDDVKHAHMGSRVVIPCLGTMWPDYRNVRGDFLRHRPVKQRVRFTRQKWSIPFGFSDLYQCGLTQDVKNFASQEVKDIVKGMRWSTRSIEQLWWVSYLNTFKGYKLNPNDLERNARQYWDVMVKNVVPLGCWQARAINIKNKYRNNFRYRPTCKFYVWPKQYSEARSRLEVKWEK